MKIITEFPRAVREIENEWITLADGCRLAARIWLPEDAERDPVPAILEFLPYRKREGTAERDALTHPYFAGHGYACVRVDMRGSGESDGILEDEYIKQEQDDCLEVLRWIAAQPWCTGGVGMIGISWGGFNGLQVAARCPPELKAVITLCSTDDRYADDVHFMGGCLLNDNLGWASAMFGLMSRPPDPALVGARWREMWIERLEKEPLLVETWLRHQRRDAYWKHGSVCEDFSAIQCPVYAVGGWADGYSNAIPRLLAGLAVPRKGLIGPWAHKYPHFAKPGPAIGFLQECLRWWDQWLRGRDTGIMGEPMYRVWMQDWVAPAPKLLQRPGRWVAETAWPSANIRTWTLPFDLARKEIPLPSREGQGEGVSGGGPSPDPLPQGEGVPFSSPLDTGLAAGRWCPYGEGPDLATDQREDDGKSLTFDSAALQEALEILGAPAVELELSADRANAFVAVRLNDVAPDGTSLRVTYGLLNLTHREGHEQPQPLEPGRRYRVRVQLNDIAHGFRAGHRLRVALSTSYWPIAWPSPEPVTLTVFGGALELPVRPARAEDALLPAFAPPESAAPQQKTILRAGRDSRGWERDVATGETVLRAAMDEGLVRLDAHGLEYAATRALEYRTGPNDPASAAVTTRYSIAMGRGDWRIRTETQTTMRATAQAFLLDATLDAYEGGRRVVSRSWSRRVPRDGV